MKNHRSPTLSRNEEAKAELEAKSKIVIEWMQELLKEKLPGDTLQDKLEDGVALCKIVNALKPGCLRNFHRKPKMLMMKLENIGFFLTTCKTRFKIDQNTLFSPQDVHEKTDDHSNMLRVLTVLMLLIKEAGYNIAGLEKLPDLSEHTEDTKTDTQDEKNKDSKETKHEEEEEITVDRWLSTTSKENMEVREKKADPPTRVQEENHIKKTPSFEKITETVTNHVPVKGSWYIQGNFNEYVDIQQEVSSEIINCIHSELSLESKLNLLGEVVKNNNSIEEKLYYSGDNELRNLCFEMGLGTSLDDVPKGKDRRWYVDWIVKYGRSNK